MSEEGQDNKMLEEIKNLRREIELLKSKVIVMVSSTITIFNEQIQQLKIKPLSIQKISDEILINGYKTDKKYMVVTDYRNSFSFRINCNEMIELKENQFIRHNYKISHSNYMMVKFMLVEDK